MKAKFYDSNREGKWYPTIELDFVEIFDQYLESMGEFEIEHFIEQWIGHKKFLEVATKYMIEAYSGNNVDVDTTKTRANLLEALTDNRIGVAADKCTQSLRDKWYYETRYWQFYHGMSKFLCSMSTEDAQRWSAFFLQFQEENPAPSIGSNEWYEYGKKAHNDVLNIIKESLDTNI